MNFRKGADFRRSFLYHNLAFPADSGYNGIRMASWKVKTSLPSLPTLRVMILPNLAPPEKFCPVPMMRPVFGRLQSEKWRAV